MVIANFKFQIDEQVGKKLSYSTEGTTDKWHFRFKSLVRDFKEL